MTTTLKAIKPRYAYQQIGVDNASQLKRDDIIIISQGLPNEELVKLVDAGFNFVSGIFRQAHEAGAELTKAV